MTQLRYLIVILIAGLALAFTGCGGSSSTPPNLDRDGDGIPNAEDRFPDDATKFAEFTRVDLLPLTVGAFSAALDINDAAAPMIVGTADRDGILKAVKWAVDGTAAPEILPAVAGNTYSAAFANNDAGAAVGESAKGLNFVPVYWALDTETATELKLIQTTTVEAGEPVVTILGTSGAAYGINSAGQIVGEIKRTDGSLMAVIWKDAGAEPVELPALGGDSAAAYSISNAGWVVGESKTDLGADRATLWEVGADGVVIGAPLNLGRIEGHAKSIALAVDNEERIVGESEQTDGTVHAILWTPAAAAGEFTMTELGTGASAQAINDGNRIAGYAGAGPLAAVWDTRLADPENFTAILSGTGFSQAYGQNEGNAIVGIAGNRAFVATPQ